MLFITREVNGKGFSTNWDQIIGCAYKESVSSISNARHAAGADIEGKELSGKEGFDRLDQEKKNPARNSKKFNKLTTLSLGGWYNLKDVFRNSALARTRAPKSRSDVYIPLAILDVNAVVY